VARILESLFPRCLIFLPSHVFAGAVLNDLLNAPRCIRVFARGAGGGCERKN
jgi:hypothetical protein